MSLPPPPPFYPPPPQPPPPPTPPLSMKRKRSLPSALDIFKQNYGTDPNIASRAERVRFSLSKNAAKSTCASPVVPSKPPIANMLGAPQDTDIDIPPKIGIKKPVSPQLSPPMSPAAKRCNLSKDQDEDIPPDTKSEDPIPPEWTLFTTTSFHNHMQALLTSPSTVWSPRSPVYSPNSVQSNRFLQGLSMWAFKQRGSWSEYSKYITYLGEKNHALVGTREVLKATLNEVSKDKRQGEKRLLSLRDDMERKEDARRNLERELEERVEKGVLSEREYEVSGSG